MRLFHDGSCACGCAGKNNLMSKTYLSKAGHDTSSLSSDPSLLPAHTHRHHHMGKNRTAAFIQLSVYVLPSEIPLDRVELSACPRVGVWLSITLSSNKWRDPALGNVALLNSTVFILWIKLCDQHRNIEAKKHEIYIFFTIYSTIQGISDWNWLVSQTVALPVSIGQQVSRWRRCGWNFGSFSSYCTFSTTERRGWCFLA